jgi:PPOX class probable F420-dependent enzyme
MTLADAATQRFLATKEVVVLATLQADGAPLAMPMWFLHDPSAITMISVDDLQKVKNLRRDPRVCMVAESADANGIRGVTIQGRAEFLADSPERRALVERLLTKYHPRLEKLWGGRAMPPNRVMFKITPSRVLSWGLT